MGVYDTATKLASEIKNSKEYRTFKKNMQEVRADKECEELLKNYRTYQLELQNYAMQNKKMDKKSMKVADDIQRKVTNNKKLYNYLNSEQKFTQMMNNINKVLADAVKPDYE